MTTSVLRGELRGEEMPHYKLREPSKILLFLKTGVWVTNSVFVFGSSSVELDNLLLHHHNHEKGPDFG